ncbi:FAD/NAD(P)-binding domain-containing protein [Gautieria morchelliformis]|nr:FAD/NAD(P)-binding domain-containing protein [Gautieria morchelliformis]
MSPKRQVVIVGGGGSGAGLARALSAKLDSTKHSVTLISAHPYMVYYPATLRLLATEEGSLENRMLIPYDKLFVNGNGTFKHGTVTAIETEKGSKVGGKVILQDGQSVHYDVLVLAPGFKWEAFLDFPFDAAGVQEHIKEWRAKFRNAEKIVIGGGGAVGIELAGELKQFYPDKKITIVHGGKKLLNKAYPDKVRKDVERRIRHRGVEVILDDFIDPLPEGTPVTTRKGVKLNADLIVPARGGRPNTSWIVDALGKDVADERGFLHIKPTLQLAAHPTIFAMGDAIDFPEQKQFGKYPVHIGVVAANVSSVLNGVQPKKEYKGQADILVLTMGSTGGVSFFGWLWGLMFGDSVTSTVKGKALFIPAVRKGLGLVD